MDNQIQIQIQRKIENWSEMPLKNSKVNRWMLRCLPWYPPRSCKFGEKARGSEKLQAIGGGRRMFLSKVLQFYFFLGYEHINVEDGINWKLQEKKMLVKWGKKLDFRIIWNVIIWGVILYPIILVINCFSNHLKFFF